jgi:hypothetical protein
LANRKDGVIVTITHPAMNPKTIDQDNDNASQLVRNTAPLE